MKKSFKKSMAVFMTAVIMLSCWVWGVPFTSKAMSNSLFIDIDFTQHKKSWMINDKLSFSNNDLSPADIIVSCLDRNGKQYIKKIEVFNDEKITTATVQFDCSAAPEQIDFIFGYLLEGEYKVSPLNFYWGGVKPIVVEFYGSSLLSDTIEINANNIETFDSQEYIYDIMNMVEAHTYVLSACYTYKFPKVANGYNSVRDKFSFPNYNANIDEEFYKKKYGDAKGTTLYVLHELFGSHGLCFGIASTTSMLLAHPELVSKYKDNTNEYADYIFDLDINSWSSYYNDILENNIKYSHIYQFSAEAKKAENATENDLRGLVNATKSYVNGNSKPILLNIYSTFINTNKDHSVLVVGYKETDSNIILLIDDSNSPYELLEFRIAKDFSGWSYTSGSYNYSSDDGRFTYIDISKDIYNYLNSTKNYISQNNVLLYSNSDFNTLSQLTPVSSAKCGDGLENEKEKLYWLAENEKNIELISLSDNNKIILSDVETSVEITLDGDKTANFYVDDAGKSMFDYQIESGKETKAIITTSSSKIEIDGTASSDTVTATQTDTGLLVTGISDGTVTLTKDDEVIATEEIKDAVGDIEITYDKEGESEELDADYHTHSYDSAETKAPTCKETGTVTYTCSCGDTYTEEIEINPDNHIGETEIRSIKDSTCTEKGYTGDTYCLDCGEKIAEGKETDIKGHKDADRNYSCDECGATLENNCSHMCHKTGFMGFIWKILRIFFKLFGSQPVCSCGVAHY